MTVSGPSRESVTYNKPGPRNQLRQVLAELRERFPFYRTNSDIWVVSRFDDVEAVQSNPQPKSPRYTEAIVAHCEELAAFPRRGRARDDIRPGLRTIGFRRRVVIAFAVLDQTVAIVLNGGPRLRGGSERPRGRFGGSD